MFAIRNVKLSVHKKISDLFTAPPNNPDTGTPYLPIAYNVYNEDNYQNDAFDPTPPFVFILMSRVPPKKTRLPCIIMEFADFPNIQYELGTRRGMDPQVILHIFARNRGERDDMSGYIRLALTDYVGITLYDWTAGPVTKYTGQIGNDIDVQEQTIGPDIGLEGSLLNWVTVSFSLPFLKE